MYAGAAKVVGFSCIVRRKKPRDLTPAAFERLAAQFNCQLRKRAEETDGKPTFFFWHRHLHRYISEDGVHPTRSGYRRLFHSFKWAIEHGQQLLSSHNRAVFFATQCTYFD